MAEKINNREITDELKKNFILYAKDINKSRAFPHLLPGIKPIAGHALWAMYVNGRRFNKPYTKSAKVTGEVMSYSPHGDSYDSLVRLAQDFTYHIPYIDGHGSFGSVIGGPTPGAARYTEIRLSEFIQDVLFYNTKLLDMGLNYLEEDEEPILEKWVALLPLLFMTNTSGMGFTVSNNWSSGNLLEFKEQLVEYLKTGKVDCSKIYPDFPTGGVIINKSEMKELFETGKGTIKLRGKTEIDGNKIKILSLPYQTYPEQFLEDVKKYITNNNHTIVDVANRCGKNGFLIEIECEKDTAEYTLDQLFRKTCLQTSISNERKAVDESGKPVMITFASYMRSFVESNIELVIKEANLNLEEINARLELVNGLLNALDIIDEIIKEIKKSKSMDDAKQAIMKMKKYKFTERQADFIVHTPLGRLANLEQVKLQDEKKELEEQKRENEELLSSRKKQEKYFLNRFNKLVDKYGWERKTELTDVVMTQDETTKTAKPEKLRVKKEFMLVLTEGNRIKKIEMTKYRKIKSDEKSVKVQQGGKVTIVTNLGMMYKIPINKIDKCLPNAAGTDIKSIISFEGDILSIFSNDIALPYIVFVTKEGLGKKCEVSKTIGISKSSGTQLIKFKVDGDELLDIKLVNDKDTLEFKTTREVKTLQVKDMKVASRGAAGNKLVKLKSNEKLEEVHSV